MLLKNLAKKQTTNTSPAGVPSVLPKEGSVGESFKHVRNSETLQRINQSEIRLIVAIRPSNHRLGMCRVWMMVVFLNTCWNGIQGMRK